MTFNDPLSVLTVNVGTTQVNGSATALPVYASTSGAHYQCDVTRATLAGNGEYGSGSGQVANTSPTNGVQGGLDQVIECDVTNGVIYIDLPSINLAVPPTNQPFKGRTITIMSNGAAANAVTITPLSTGSGSTAPAIDSGTAGAANSTLLPASLRRAVTLVFDGLNWNVLSKSPSTNT
jgi:hypothetical protein